MHKGKVDIMRKVFVGVKLEVSLEGIIKPIAIKWEDGREFEIQQVTDVRRAASMGAGGTGTRYMCMIKDKLVPLYYEDPRWFMEGK
jgi:hypothetical protein